MVKNLLTKRALIDQANSTVVIVAGIAAFIFVFSLVASKTLISQAGYQGHVIKAKKEAVSQLRDDIKVANTLNSSYTTFVDANPNVLGGNSTGDGATDGDNAQLILDALPSSYDFPALATTIEKLITNQAAATGTTQSLTINSITGTDDELAQSANVTSGKPIPVAMPFQLSVTGDYASIQALIGQFQHSIRPFQIQTLDISGDQDKLTANISAQTFYQPAKTFNIGQKVVK